MAACAAVSPPPSVTPTCAPWPDEIRLSLRPEGGRRLVTLAGMGADAPFSLSYAARRGEEAVSDTFDARAGTDGTYRFYATPPGAAEPPYPSPEGQPVLGGKPTSWHFILRYAGGTFCLEMTEIP